MDANPAPKGTEPTARVPSWRWVHLLDALVPLLLGTFVIAAAWPALAPSSVWIDDAWVALAAKASSPSQFWETTITAHGFTALLAGWLRTVGLAGLGGAAPQALPLLFGFAAPGALWLGLRRWCHWPVPPALVAAGLVATSPLVVTFSTRVKQYTLDVLLAALLTTFAIGITHHFTARRQWQLSVGGTVSIVLSAATASVAGAAVLVAWGAAAVAAATRGDADGHAHGGTLTDVRPPHLLSTVRPVAAFGAFALAWQFLVLSHTIPEGMYTFWRAQFLPVADGPGAVATATWQGLQDVSAATIALPVGLVLALAAIGMWRNRWACPAIGAMLVVPVLASITLALLQRAPWGGGRTDSHLVVALAVAVGAAFFGPMGEEKSWIPRPFMFGRVAPGLVAAFVLLWAGFLVERPTYPQEDLRPLLTILEDGIADDEVILVYPFARLAYALYTPAPVTFKPNEGSSVGYALDIEDDRVVLLPGWRRDPTQYAPIVADLTSGTCGVWLPASHVSDDLDDVKAALTSAGFTQVEDSWGGNGATLSHWRATDRPGC